MGPFLPSRGSQAPAGRRAGLWTSEFQGKSKKGSAEVLRKVHSFRCHLQLGVPRHLCELKEGGQGLRWGAAGEKATSTRRQGEDSLRLEALWKEDIGRHLKARYKDSKRSPLLKPLFPRGTASPDLDPLPLQLHSNPLGSRAPMPSAGARVCLSSSFPPPHFCFPRGQVSAQYGLTY